MLADMMNFDAFSQWLGIGVLSYEAGSCEGEMTVCDEMCSGLGATLGQQVAKLCLFLIKA